MSVQRATRVLQRFGQTAAFQIHRRQTARQRARALNRARHQIGDLGDLRRVLRRLSRHLHLEAFHQQRQTGELLAQAVVQIAAEAALLAIGDFEDLLLQLFALSHFLHGADEAGHSCHDLAAARA